MVASHLKARSDPRWTRRFFPRSPMLIGVLTLCGLLAGCGSGDESPGDNADSAAFAGVALRLAVPRGSGLREVWQVPVSEWAVQTGAECVIAEYELAELDDLFSEDGGPAAVVCPLTEVPQLVRAGHLRPIAERDLAADRLDWNGLFKGLRETVCSPGGRPTVVPLSAPVLVCYYRRDLLEQAGLQPPETWDDYASLVRSLDDWAPGLSVVEPWGEPFRATMFLARSAAYAAHPVNLSVLFDIETGRPLVDGPGFVAALRRAVQDVAAMPEAVLSMSPADCRRELLEGRAALGIAWESGAFPLESELSATGAGSADAAQPGSSRTEGIRLGVTTLPGVTESYDRTTGRWSAPPSGGIHRATLTAFGGLALAVNSHADDQAAQAAWDLIRALMVERPLTQLPLEVRSLCRESQLDDPLSWVGRGLTGEEARQYANAVAGSLRQPHVLAELPVTDRAAFRDALTDGLSRALSGELEAEAALTEVARRWQELVQQHGAERIRDVYRVGVGLQPIAEPLSP